MTIDVRRTAQTSPVGPLNTAIRSCQVDLGKIREGFDFIDVRFFCLFLCNQAVGSRAHGTLQKIFKWDVLHTWTHPRTGYNQFPLVYTSSAAPYQYATKQPQLFSSRCGSSTPKRPLVKAHIHIAEKMPSLCCFIQNNLNLCLLLS